MEPGKESEWNKQIINEVKEYDKHSISEWFTTIIYCLSADTDRVEDFEIKIIENLINEKNNVNVVITHCKSQNDDRAIRMKKRVVENTNVSSDSVLFVSNYEKKLLSGKVEKFGRDKVIKSIIRNLWNNFKMKVPYRIKAKVEEEFRNEHDKLHNMVASTNFLLRKRKGLDKFQEKINAEFEQFIEQSVKKFNNEFNEAYEYYRRLSNEYYIIGFGMDIKKLLNDPIMIFDATSSFRENVSLVVERLSESTGRIIKFMNEDVSKELLKKFFEEIKINLSMPGTIRDELHDTVDQYILNTKKAVLEEVKNVESKLCQIEVQI